VALPDLFTISDFGLRRQEAVTGTADLKTVTFEGDTAGAAPSRTVLLASSHLQEDATAKVVVIAVGLDEVARRLSDCSPVVRGSTLTVDGNSTTKCVAHCRQHRARRNRAPAQPPPSLSWGIATSGRRGKLSCHAELGFVPCDLFTVETDQHARRARTRADRGPITAVADFERSTMNLGRGALSPRARTGTPVSPTLCWLPYVRCR
jgi:hypothetical protein